MSKAEIYYIVPEATRRQHDVELVLAAIGAYQEELHYSIPLTAEIEQKPSDSVMLRLIRSSLTPMYDHDLLEATEEMRKGVEAHFLETDMPRLSRLFSGINIIDPIEVEKS